MCLFEHFELYTSKPRIKMQYYMPGETIKEYRRRQRQWQRDEATRNIAQNATGQNFDYYDLGLTGDGSLRSMLEMSKIAEDAEPVRYIAHSGITHTSDCAKTIWEKQWPQHCKQCRGTGKILIEEHGEVPDWYSLCPTCTDSEDHHCSWCGDEGLIIIDDNWITSFLCSSCMWSGETPPECNCYISPEIGDDPLGDIADHPF